MTAKAKDVYRVLNVYYVLRNEIRQDKHVGTLESSAYIQEDGSLMVNVRGAVSPSVDGRSIYAAGVWLKYNESVEKGGATPESNTPFRLGLETFREMVARYIAQGGDGVTARSIRSYWLTSWGEDPGPLAED